MDNIEIYKVPESRNYWLVRSHGGTLFDHFISSNVVAVSYLDKPLGEDVEGLVNSNEGQYLAGTLLFNEFSEDPWEALINTVFPSNKKSAKLTKNKGQLKHFLTDMAIGDWVITLSGDRVRIGVLKSDAYYSDKVLISNQKPDLPEDASFVRREVDWGPELSRKSLSANINKTLRSQQTIVSLKNHIVDIHHYLFPIFVHEEKVFVSINIGRPSDIPLGAMSNFFDVISRFSELTLDEGEGSSATVKAYFFSEGQIRLSTFTGPKTIVTVGAAYVVLSSIFNGNEKIGTKPLYETIGNAKKAASAFTESLQVSIPSLDTTKLRGYDMEENLIDLNEVKDNLP